MTQSGAGPEQVEGGAPQGHARTLVLAGAGLAVVGYLLGFFTPLGTVFLGPILLLVGGLLAAATLLPKTRGVLLPAALLSAVGFLAVLQVAVSSTIGFGLGGLEFAVLALAFLQAAAVSAVLLLDAGVISLPAPKQPAAPAYGPGYPPYGQGYPPPGGGGYVQQPSPYGYAGPQQGYPGYQGAPYGAPTMHVGPGDAGAPTTVVPVQPGTAGPGQPGPGGSGVPQVGAGGLGSGLGSPGSGAAQSGAGQPGTAQPGAAQPGVAQPGVAQPGAGQPGTAQPGAAQPGPGQPGAQAHGGAVSATQPGGMSAVQQGAPLASLGSVPLPASASGAGGSHAVPTPQAWYPATETSAPAAPVVSADRRGTDLEQTRIDPGPVVGDESSGRHGRP